MQILRFLRFLWDLIIKLIVNIMDWGLEALAFVLLPLLIYYAVFNSLGVKAIYFIGLPEWMFISIILFGHCLKDLIYTYHYFEDFETKLVRCISIGILGFAASIVFLVLTLVEQHQKEFHLSIFAQLAKFFIFCFAVIFSAFAQIWRKTLLDHKNNGLIMQRSKNLLKDPANNFAPSEKETIPSPLPR
jgi:hypothetical protein